MIEKFMIQMNMNVIYVIRNHFMNENFMIEMTMHVIYVIRYNLIKNP